MKPFKFILVLQFLPIAAIVFAVIVLISLFSFVIIPNNSLSEIPKITPTVVPEITITETPLSTTIIPTLTNSPIPTSTFTPKPTATFTPIKTPAEINIGNTSKKQMIFTFDAGSGNNSIDNILTVLKKYNVKGTFFLTGKWMEAYPNDTKAIANAGHEIFNHTYDHPYLTQISDEQIKTEFQKMDDILKNLTGLSSKPFFRPPYGSRNQHVWDYVYSLGYRSVYWTVDALDWKESTGTTTLDVKNRIYANEKNGAIVLMHVGDNITGNILDEVFQKITNDGYKIVNLSQGI